jgi:hypothetical protein
MRSMLVVARYGSFNSRVCVSRPRTCVADTPTVPAETRIVANNDV